MKKIGVLIVATLLVVMADAAVKLPRLITSNMVLQRSTVVNLWGWASPNTKVNVTTSWNDQTFEAKVDDSGAWLVKVPTPQAGGPYTITFDDGEKTIVDNVLIGEVWVCSGQSNMAMPLRGYTGQPIENSLHDILVSGGYKQIRMFSIFRNPVNEKRQDVKTGTWETSENGNLANNTAVGYYFAEYLHLTLGVPVGIIDNSVGGSPIQAWMPEEIANKIDKDLAQKSLKKKDYHKTSWLYNGMMYPIRNYTARGFLWYQGEANRGDLPFYADFTKSMVTHWRDIWGDKDYLMPFYCVEIAPYCYNNDKTNISRARFVEEQIRSVAVTPNAGIVSTSDLGNEPSIHPSQKRPIAQRLASLALNKTYGMEAFPTSGPVYESVEFSGDKALVTFKSEWGGLDYTQDSIIGFEIAGADSVFYTATARIPKIKKLVVEVSSEKVAKPVAVRYCYKNFIRGNLRNMYMIPCSPFRTDNW